MQTFKIGTTNYKWINNFIVSFNNNCKEIYLEYGDYLNEKCDLIIDDMCFDWNSINDYSKFILNEVNKIPYKTEICVISPEPHAFPIKDYEIECSDNLFQYTLDNYYTISHFVDSKTNCFYPYIMNELNKLPHQIIKNDKDKFCAIISSTPSIHRIKFIDLLNTYKSVDVYGKINNNYIQEDNINNIMSQYKFTLAIENSKSIENEFYITEKIVKSFCWGGVPIYYGSDYVKEIFNEKSFINCNNLSDEEILNKIIEIDNDDQLYNEMLNTQPLLDLDIKNKFDKKMYEFIKNILLKNI